MRFSDIREQTTHLSCGLTPLVSIRSERVFWCTRIWSSSTIVGNYYRRRTLRTSHNLAFCHWGLGQLDKAEICMPLLLVQRSRWFWSSRYSECYAGAGVLISWIWPGRKSCWASEESARWSTQGHRHRRWDVVNKIQKSCARKGIDIVTVG